jgi:hypothetical protein
MDAFNGDPAVMYNFVVYSTVSALSGMSKSSTSRPGVGPTESHPKRR